MVFSKLFKKFHKQIRQDINLIKEVGVLDLCNAYMLFDFILKQT